jgi:hypothetical protein
LFRPASSNSNTAQVSEGEDNESEMVEKGRTERAAAAAAAEEESRVTLPFQPLSLCFNHINYYVDMPAVSLHMRSCFLMVGIYRGETTAHINHMVLVFSRK